MLRLLTIVAAVAAIASTAEAAGPRRVAVLIGANEASPGTKPLRYAHLDAYEMERVLNELAGFSREDIHVLLDPDPGRVLDVLDRQLDMLGKSSEETLLFFYYSGHADAQSLFPGGKSLRLSYLRKRLDDPRAGVRLSLIDACRGGGWTGAKGLTESDVFEVHQGLELNNEGSALISSSSGLEDAHESEALRSSFFTHHWIAGLRGAADLNEDARVTLSEAFEYAKSLTIRDTAMHAAETQHPSFQYNLTGRQDLPLSILTAGRSRLKIRQRNGPIQIVRLESGVLVSELPKGPRAVTLALIPGRYLVRKRNGNRAWAKEIVVHRAGTFEVAEADLAKVDMSRLASKGYDDPLKVLAVADTAPTGIARAELVVFQTIHGAGMGAELCAAMKCEDPRAWVATTLAGGSLGLGLSMGLTKNGISPGHTLLINSSTIWGMWQGLAISNAINDGAFKDPWGPMLVGQLGGLATGVLLRETVDPSSGDVAFTNTLALWGGLLSVMGHAASDFRGSRRSMWITLLVASDVAGLGGALLATKFPMSRGRSFLLNAGGALGVLVGMGGDMLVEGQDFNKKAFYGAGVAGGMVGLGLTAFLTRNWDVPKPRGDFSIAPNPEGGISAGWRMEF